MLLSELTVTALLCREETGQRSRYNQGQRSLNGVYLKL